MNKPSGKLTQTWLIIVAIVAWLGLAIQLYIIIKNRAVSIPETIVRYFSYFTILSNILVALYATHVLLKPRAGLRKYFSGASTAAAIALYITVVGIAYNILLRRLWSPQGLERVGDEITHLIVPLLFFLYWLFFAPKDTLKWKDSFPWLVFPLLYFTWTMIFGALSGFYPYYFVNVNELGYSRVFFNSVMLVAGFFLLSLIFISIGKRMKPSLSVT
ncbi:MAG: Pr6Pr family membrane protein [Chitinophagaceae bacterium]